MTPSHPEMPGPCVTPSAVIGWGAWGARIAMRAAEALRQRCPELAPACPVLPLAEAGPDAPGQVRAHLRAGRMAGVIRTLEQQGLLRLDPVLSPPTHVYLVGSASDDPDLANLRDLAGVVRQAGADLHAGVTLTLLLDLGGTDDPAPTADLPLPAYLLEPVTSHGLSLQPEEYEAAVVELLVASAQPGGSQLLAAGRESVGTLGIAWLAWDPTELRTRLTRRLARQALAQCLQDAPATAPPAGRAAPPPTEWDAGRSNPEADRPFTGAGRVAALLEGLPFSPAAAPDSSGPPSVTAPRTLLGDPHRRAHRARYLRRCAAVLERRTERWARSLQRSARGQVQREAAALEQAIAQEIRTSPGGFARARHLLESLRAQVTARLHQPPAPPSPPLVVGRLRALERAEALPAPGAVAMGLGIAWVGISLGLWALDGTREAMLAWASALLAGGIGYAAYRARRIRRATDRALTALLRRAEGLLTAALHQKLDALDLALDERCRALRAELDQSLDALHAECRPQSEPAAAAPAEGGALSFPLVEPGLPAHADRDLQPLLPELAERLCKAGCLDRWREPAAVMARAEETTAAFLTSRFPADPGQMAADAYGDRLGDRLYEAVARLLAWSRPLLGRCHPLPEGRSYLLWPEGLPCPAVPPEVQVLPGARGCAAAVTVVDRLPTATGAGRPLTRDPSRRLLS